jgi:hypothetical protein
MAYGKKGKKGKKSTMKAGMISPRKRMAMKGLKKGGKYGM